MVLVSYMDKGMKRLRVGIYLLSAFLCSDGFGQDGFPDLSGPYIGQTPPGSIPELFASGVVSTEENEHFSPSFSPDGKEAYWSLWRAGSVIVYRMAEEEGKWSTPHPLFFRPDYHEDGVYFSPDGDRLYFYSKRPVEDGGGKQEDWDIWYVERQGASWGGAVHLGAPVNTDAHEVFPSVTRDGTLYFVILSDKRELYRSVYQDGSYQSPTLLPEHINRDAYYSHIYVDPNDQYLIFCSNRPGGYGSGDLYISFKQAEGTWSEAVNMGPVINTDKLERFPQVTQDGRYLLFARHVDTRHATGGSIGQGDIYWVDASAIESLRPPR